jgi:ribosomal-protein-alanine N-acetyltransferase
VIVLVPATRARLESAITEPETMGSVLGVAVEPGWNVVPEAWVAARIDLEADEAFADWPLFFVVLDGVLVGQCGFHAPPDAEGAVEIGYAVAPGARGRGIASEVAATLVERGFAAGASSIVAQVAVGSATAIIDRLGFVRVAEVVDPTEGPVWRYLKAANAR